MIVMVSNQTGIEVRVNGMPRLLAAWHAGAISVDGTGWFHKGRGYGSQAADLRQFLRETSAAPSPRADLIPSPRGPTC